MDGPTNITRFEEWAVAQLRKYDMCRSSKARAGRKTPILCTPSADFECCVCCWEWAEEDKRA